MHLAFGSAEADAYCFEPTCVVPLEHSRDQPSDGMVIEVRGQIREADAIMALNVASTHALGGRVLLPNKVPSDAVQVGRIAEERKTCEWRERDFAGLQINLKVRQVLVARCPIATTLQAEEQASARVFVVRILLQHVPVVRGRLLETTEREKRIGAAEDGFDVVGAELQRTVVARNRVLWIAA